MVSVPPTENPVPALASANVLDLPSVSLGNSDCEVSLPPSLPTELSDQPALASDAEPPTSETLATVSSVVPVAEEGTIVLAAPASAEKITNVCSSDPEQSKATATPSAPEQTEAPILQLIQQLWFRELVQMKVLLRF
ncbi:hypothetical protein F2Q70_00030599 [Brassica cretica]|uniref:Uncharacterized protein n=1 Tax=Brassica cretica TaxID=69181 RepID=A0A8S9FKF3_BRACR|nr:hypothetical protein F2Q70_00030599 [Brassica cretica]